MAARPALSICIPTYRRPDLLRRALTSAITAATPHAERVQIVVSDNSPAETGVLARELLAIWIGEGTYVGNDPDIGIVQNLNQCVARASGDWVLILHDDDYLLPNGVAAILAAIDSGTDADRVMLFGVTTVDLEGRIIRRQEFERDVRLRPAAAMRHVLSDSSFVRFPGVIVRRDAYTAIGAFDEAVGPATDFAMWIRLFAAYGARLLPTTASAYTVHAGAQTSGMFTPATVGQLMGLFDAAAATKVLPVRVIRRCQRDWFHQFILGGAYRCLRAGDPVGARRVMALMDEAAVRRLGLSRRWLPVRVVLGLLTRLPGRVAASLTGVLAAAYLDLPGVAVGTGAGSSKAAHQLVGRGLAGPSGGMSARVRHAWQWLYRWYAVRANVQLGRDVHLGIGTILWAPTRLVVGDHVYIGKFCTIECDGRIGDDVIMANQVGLVGRRDHNHRAVGRTIRHAPWIGDTRGPAPGRDLQVVIEGDNWVGYGAIVLSGVTIHHGAIVAAGAVVTHDVEAYAIVAGNPARKVGMRFTDDEIARHEAAIGHAQVPTVSSGNATSPRA
jgi:acetyltransferase-like isoleucine patch superfamily enzyme